MEREPGGEQTEVKHGKGSLEWNDRDKPCKEEAIEEQTEK